MLSLSFRYIYSITKKYDGIKKGSASLWSARLAKGYGVLSEKLDHNKTIEEYPVFNYSKEQISIARRLRAGFYERILEPNGIISALPYSPISIDIEIFSSIYGDKEGFITLPDEDDKKEEYSHSVNVLAFDKQNNTFKIDTGWREWEENRIAEIPFEYLDKYMLSGWYISHFALLINKNKRKYTLKKFVLVDREWTLKVFTEFSATGDKRRLLNMEIYNDNEEICGWMHYAYDKINTFEILDLFILEEYRRLGLASFVLNELKSIKNIKQIYGYISAYDLIGEREEIVKSFFLKNNFLPILDYSHFKDCRYRFELN